MRTLRRVGAGIAAILGGLSGASLPGCAHANPAQQAQRVMLPALTISAPEPADLEPQRFADADAYTHYLLGNLAANQGDFEAAAEHYRLAAGLDPQSADIWVKYAAVLVRKGDLVRAQAALERAVRLDSQSVAAHMMLANIAASRGDHEQAIAAYRKVIELDPENPEAYVYLSSIYAQKNDIAAAERILKDLLARSPDSVVAYYYLAHLQAERKNLQEAKHYYEAALKLQPRFQPALVEYALILELSGDTKAAIAKYREILEYYPERDDIRRRLGQIYIKSSDLPNALAEFKALANSDANNLDLRLTIGLIYLEQDDYDRALEEFRYILATNPQAYKVHLYVGAVLAKQGQSDKARAEYERVPASAIEYTDAQIQIALLDVSAGKRDAAYTRLRTLIVGTAATPEAFDLLASLYREDEQFDEALAVIGAGLRKFPDDERMLYALGVTYDLKGEWQKAVEQMRAILERNANHAQALNYIGYTYAEKGIQLDEAEALLKRAVALEPSDGYILDSLGWVYYQKGDYARARELLTKARELANDDPIILEHLAETALKLGQRADAERWFRTALQSQDLKPKDRSRIAEKFRLLTTNRHP